MSRFEITGFRSSSEWEDSLWGGFKKVLWDHPEIKMDDGLEWENKHTDDLGYYHYSKLIKLFLMHSKKNGVAEYLTKNLKSEKITKWFRNYTRYTFDPDMIRYAVDFLQTSGIELSNMFVHYGDVINKTKFHYDVPENGEGDNQGEGDGQGDKEDDEGKSQGQNKSPSIEQIIDEIIESVKERKAESNQGDWYGGWGGDSNKEPEFHIMKNGSPCRYEPLETLQANQLVNLLDISFDPAVDKIGALKSGKLEVSKICEIPSGNFNVYYRKEENISTKPFSVCILMDESESMDKGFGTKLYHATSMMKVLYKAFSQIIPQDKMFLYGHSGFSTPKISVYHDKYNQNFETTIYTVGKYQGNNYDGPVMNAIYEKVRGFTDDNIIFLVLSDGQPCSWGNTHPIVDMKRIIEKCKRDNFVTMGVGIQSNYVKGIYSYCTVVNNPEKELVRNVSLLINQVVKQEFQN